MVCWAGSHLWRYVHVWRSSRRLWLYCHSILCELWDPYVASPGKERKIFADCFTCQWEWMFYPMCGHYRNISSQALAGSLLTVWSCDTCIYILQQLVKLFSDQIRVFYWDYVISGHKYGIYKVSPANWHRRDFEKIDFFTSKNIDKYVKSLNFFLIMKDCVINILKYIVKSANLISRWHFIVDKNKQLIWTLINHLKILKLHVRTKRKRLIIWLC